MATLDELILEIPEGSDFHVFGGWDDGITLALRSDEIFITSGCTRLRFLYPERVSKFLAGSGITTAQTVPVEIPDGTDFLAFGGWVDNDDLVITSDEIPIPQGCTRVQLLRSERATKSLPPSTVTSTQTVPAVISVPMSDQEVPIPTPATVLRTEDGKSYSLSYDSSNGCCVKVWASAPQNTDLSTYSRARAAHLSYSRARKAQSTIERSSSSRLTPPPSSAAVDTKTMRSRANEYKLRKNPRTPSKRKKDQTQTATASQENPRSIQPISSAMSQDPDKSSDTRKSSIDASKMRTRSCLKPARPNSQLVTLPSPPPWAYHQPDSSTPSTPSKKVRFTDQSEIKDCCPMCGKQGWPYVENGLVIITCVFHQDIIPVFRSSLPLKLRRNMPIESSVSEKGPGPSEKRKRPERKSITVRKAKKRS